ncbi:MAG: beta-propeller domain-containing protein, partial [Acidimicrobiales bacterium]|nr:beta-propeller domain-containing protein [Acidimicrobiales bacterium]
RPVPFEGGPVPCDEVLHPEGPSEPSATLLVTLPVTGELEPTAATEVVGSGSLVHVTTDAAYLATPTWSSSTPQTGIHRFDLADLTHTGSGSVEGALLNDFSMSEHDGHLRVATTVDGGCCWGGPIAVEPGIAVDDGETVFSIIDGEGSEEPAVDPAPPVSTSVPETTEPELTEPETVPEPTTTVPETSTTVAETTTTVAPETTTTTTVPDPTEGLNRIVVLDTDGDLDVVGQTERFGHPGETLRGIRFVGDTAYAVTFLQTDPFYVVDLADPAAPTVVGEVELPGFNAYLHPVGDDAVIGFGPGEDGRVTAELFDVSDPTAPRVAGSIEVGDDSPVTYDHHAFIDLGDGRFAVPAADSSGGGDLCPPDALCEATSLASEVVTLEVDGDQLREVERRSVVLDGYQQATRALPAGDGWAVLGETQIVVLDGAGDEVGRVTLT